MANPLEINALSPATGNHPHLGDADVRQHRRAQRLLGLMVALQTGPVDAARFAFTALVSHDLELMAHPSLSQIGSALQSSNLAAALHFSHALQVGPLWQ